MAIELGNNTLAVTRQERTWRLELFTERGEDPSVRAHREVVRVDGEGNVLARDRGIPAVERRLSVVAAQSFTVAGHTYTAAEIAAVIAAVADTWRHEDIAAGA